MGTACKDTGQSGHCCCPREKLILVMFSPPKKLQDFPKPSVRMQFWEGEDDPRAAEDSRGSPSSHQGHTNTFLCTGPKLRCVFRVGFEPCRAHRWTWRIFVGFSQLRKICNQIISHLWQAASWIKRELTDKKKKDILIWDVRNREYLCYISTLQLLHPGKDLGSLKWIFWSQILVPAAPTLPQTL